MSWLVDMYSACSFWCPLSGVCVNEHWNAEGQAARGRPEMQALESAHENLRSGRIYWELNYLNYRWLIILCILYIIIYPIFRHPLIWENRERTSGKIGTRYILTQKATTIKIEQNIWRSHAMKVNINSDISDNHFHI